MTLRVRTIFSGGPGAPGLNTIYFANTGGTDAQACATAVRTFWLALQGLIADVWRIDVQSEVQEITDTNGNVTHSYNTTNAQVVCTASNTGLPQAVQGLVQLRTGVFSDGREVRGRIFIPGLTQASNNVGDLASGTKSTLQTAANTMRSGSPHILAVYQRERQPYNNRKGELIPHRDGSIEVCSAVNVWSEFAVLRSRRT